ncbi:uncharacterized protein BDW47DRAFT_100699, partial [Aspergillus candidus]
MHLLILSLPSLPLPIKLPLLRFHIIRLLLHVCLLRRLLSVLQLQPQLLPGRHRRRPRRVFARHVRSRDRFVRFRRGNRIRSGGIRAVSKRL